MKKEKAIVKFNGGRLAILCNNCITIVKVGKDFTEEEIRFAKGEIKHIDPVYCDKCKNTRV
jgi:hypothetical protein